MKFHNQPDIYILIVDSLRADHLSCYDNSGKSDTPNIDSIANDGEIFTNTMSCANHTYPSFASLLTGKYPSKIGMRLKKILPQKEITIPAFLKNMYYKSVNISLLGNANNLIKDFDEHINLAWCKLREIPLSQRLPKFSNLLQSLNYLLRMYHIIRVNSNPKTPDFLGTFRNEEPLFFMVHFIEAHSPYHPPRKYWKNRISLLRRRYI